MKFKNIKYCFLLALVAVAMVSCDDDSQIFDQIIDNQQRGAILRQTDVISNSVALNTDSGLLEDGQLFAVDLEYQDQENGDLLSAMEVWLTFIDNTDDGVDNTQAERLFQTIPASDFAEGTRDLPILSYSLTGLELISALGLTQEQLGTGGDQFVVRFEVVLTDGRRFSAAQNSGNITGSYFASPFTNLVTVVCAPSVPTAGTWVVVTEDSYGDSWNGATLSVVIDGTETLVDHPAGDNVQMTEVEVPAGSSTIFITYNSGDFDGENSFTVTSANGNEVVNEGAPPRAGVELLDFCAGGL